VLARVEDFFSHRRFRMSGVMPQHGPTEHSRLDELRTGSNYGEDFHKREYLVNHETHEIHEN
jgi:hypothetical protein